MSEPSEAEAQIQRLADSVPNIVSMPCVLIDDEMIAVNVPHCGGRRIVRSGICTNCGERVVH